MPTDRAAGQEWRLAGRYRLGRVLGSGGGGIVREGDDILLRRRVAVKEVRLPLHASQAERELVGERVLREARAAARLRHPGLVTVYDVLEEDDHPWIVMEYVDGLSLAELIRQSGRLAPLRVARIGITLAYAIEAAHRAGVVHRDVKPGNVLITSDDHARLTDFGIAVTEGDTTLTGTGMLVGSPAYIPPERARGAKAAPEGDVWGLGATLFTAVEGEQPYAGDGALDILAAVVENRRRPFRHAGVLAGVLGELLDSDPRRRPSLSETRVRLREIVQRLDSAAVASAPPDAAGGAPARDGESARDGAPADGDQGLLVVHTPPALPAESGIEPSVGSKRDRAAGGSHLGSATQPPRTVVAAAGSGLRPRRRTIRSPRTALLALAVAGLLTAVAVTLSLVLTGGPSSGPSASPTAMSSAGLAATPVPTPTLSTIPATASGTASSITSAGSPPAAPAAAVSPRSSEPAPTSDGNLGALVPSTTAPAAPAAGFTSYQDPSGWSAAVPADWTRDGGSSRVTFAAPSGNPDLLIESQAVAGPSAIDAWRSLEADVQASSPDYRRVSIREADGGDGTNAAIWEFTYTSNGRTVHVLDFGVVRNGHGYALRWRAPEAGFSDGLPLMRTIFETFRPGS